MPAQIARGRHHPAHAKGRTDFLDVAHAARSGADDLLEGDDVGVDLPEHGRDAVGPPAPIHAD